MSVHFSYHGSPVPHSTADANLLLWLSFALAACQRAAWRAVRLKSHNGIVRLEGSLPSFHDRQLILSVAQHVAGVLRVEDELIVAEPEARPESVIASVATVAAIMAARKKSNAWRPTHFSISRSSTNRWRTFWQNAPRPTRPRVGIF